MYMMGLCTSSESTTRQRHPMKLRVQLNNVCQVKEFEVLRYGTKELEGDATETSRILLQQRGQGRKRKVHNLRIETSKILALQKRLKAEGSKSTTLKLCKENLRGISTRWVRALKAKACDEITCKASGVQEKNDHLPTMRTLLDSVRGECHCLKVLQGLKVFQWFNKGTSKQERRRRIGQVPT